MERKKVDNEKTKKKLMMTVKLLHLMCVIAEWSCGRTPKMARETESITEISQRESIHCGTELGT